MMSHIEMEYAKTLKQVSQLERELAEAKEQLRLCNIDQFTTAAELADAVTKERGREWVGLTDEEVNSIYETIEKVVGDHWENGGTKLMFPITLYEAIEAKLKERNSE